MTITDHDHPIDPVRVARAQDRLPTLEDASRLTSLLSLMADPVRIRLIYALDVVEELCVGDLALALGVSEDAVSYALRLLRTAGLVVTRKEGRVVYNRLAADFPAPLRDHCLRQLVELTRSAPETTDVLVRADLVAAVAARLELEGRVLDVEVADQTGLQLVEQLRGVAVVEAAVVEHDVSRQGGQVGGDGPDVQVVHVQDVLGRLQVGQDVVEVEVAGSGLQKDASGISEQAVGRAQHQRDDDE